MTYDDEQDLKRKQIYDELRRIDECVLQGNLEDASYHTETVQNLILALALQKEWEC